MTTPISQSKGIPPSQYTAHVERILSRRSRARRFRVALYLAALAILTALSL
jgi:hypothetical protein